MVVGCIDREGMIFFAIVRRYKQGLQSISTVALVPFQSDKSSPQFDARLLGVDFHRENGENTPPK